MHEALGDGRATWIEDALVPLDRHGFLEECYFTFSYSPVRGADGKVEGVLDIAAETTRQVLDRRRLALLGRLTDALAPIDHEEDVTREALGVLRGAPDLPSSTCASAASPRATTACRPVPAARWAAPTCSSRSCPRAAWRGCRSRRTPSTRAGPCSSPAQRPPRARPAYLASCGSPRPRCATP
jgi:hypothetical protein